MGFARTCSVALVGVEGVVVEVQADLEPGVAAFTLVGLPDKSLVGEPGPGAGGGGQLRRGVAAEEAHRGAQPGLRAQGRQRIRSRCGLRGAGGRRADRPAGDRRPGDDRGAGPGRPGAAGARGAARPSSPPPRRDTGRWWCRSSAAAEASLVPGVSVLGVRSLRQLIAVLDRRTGARGGARRPRAGPDPMLAGLLVPGRGRGARACAQGAAQDDTAPTWPTSPGSTRRARALEVAAAGGHHLFLERAAGRGQDDAGRAAARAAAAAHPAGVPGGHGRPLGRGHPAAGRAAGRRRPPYCAPHHSATMQSLVGGGNGTAAARARSRWPTGACSSWTRPPEFSGQALDALRQPLESGHVVIARSAGVVRLPGPVPDGARGQPLPLRAAHAARRRVRVPALGDPPLPGAAVRAAAGPGRPAGRGGAASPAPNCRARGGRGESTAAVAERVRAARERAAARLRRHPVADQQRGARA